jgi:hypothetical protein
MREGLEPSKRIIRGSDKIWMSFDILNELVRRRNHVHRIHNLILAAKTRIF